MIGFYQINKYEINNISIPRRLILAVGRVLATISSKTYNVYGKGKVNIIDIFSWTNAISINSKTSELFSYGKSNILKWSSKINNIVYKGIVTKFRSGSKQSEFNKKSKDSELKYKDKSYDINKKGK